MARILLGSKGVERLGLVLPDRLESTWWSSRCWPERLRVTEKPHEKPDRCPVRGHGVRDAVMQTPIEGSLPRG